MERKIKILVADDSAFMRKSISLLLESDPGVEVIDTAVDGIDAIDKIKKLKPDIVTLDIEMPKMDGITALGIIMKECPTPVIMLSSLTTEGADITLKALNLGAVDFIPKASSFVSISINTIKQDLLRKVKEIYKNKSVVSRVSFLNNAKKFDTKRNITNSSSTKLPSKIYKAIALGISTGGPISLQKVIPLLSDKIKIPIFVVQHMPPKFTASLAERLNVMSSIEVKEAVNGEVVRNGVVYIAPGGNHMTLQRDTMNNVTIQISELPNDVINRPSVDIMLNSVQKIYGKNTLGLIMTGMGKDGLEGVKKLKSIGGHCIAQDEKSCVVYGMPRAIVDNGLADVIASLEEIPQIINKAV